MNDVKWERYGAVAGIVFVILVVVGALIPGAPPRPDDSLREIADYYEDHTGAIKAGAFLTGLAAVAFLWFLGSLWSTIRRNEDTRQLATIAVGGGIVGLITAVTGIALNATVALALDSSGATASVNPKFIYLLSSTIGGMGNFGLAVLVLAVGVAAMRTGVFPAAFGLVSVVLAVGWLVAGLIVATDATAIFTISFIVFLLWLIWILVISFLLLRPQEQAGQAAPMAPPASSPA
jgi:preprotein translocase subunit YajC